ncbi:type IV pilus secretin PilQ [Mariprofundus micogutta]|nr:type IV pilus secretin PilQ [Mariprofundus micogutta]
MSFFKLAHACVKKLFGIMAAVSLLGVLFVPQLEAATIKGLQLLSDGSGQNLSIVMDEAAEYQVYNLEGPARVVLNFPKATMADSVGEVKGDGGVETVFPVQDSNGARIEVGLAKGTTYDIVEKGNDLLISFVSNTKRKAKAGGAEIQDISVRDKAGVTELVLRGKQMDANHNSLVTNDGKTMVLDFWGGVSKLPKEYFTYTAQRLNDVTVGAAEGRLRLVVSLRAGAGANHQIDASANQMIVRFGKVESIPTATGLTVEAVDFQPDDRIAHMVIRTNAANPIINLQEDNGKVILDIKNAALASGQERSQDVRAFPGPVNQIDSYAVNKDVRIVARLRGKAVVSSYQSGNVLTVTLKPEDMATAAQLSEEELRDEKVYSGQKVTFNYKDIDIRNALKLIAEMSELNMIMADDIKGTLTMRLVDVPWDQALDLILQARGLGKEQSGNVVRIAPLDVLKSDADARKEAQQVAEEIAPLDTDFIQLGYASVNDVSTILKGGSVTQSAGLGNSENRTTSKAETGIGGEGGLKLLSDRGSILLDERSNTMIITDTRERLNNIKRLISVIDKPMQQVLIEARIVEASDTFSRDLGIRWGGQFNSAGNKFTHGVGVGTPATLGNVVDLGAAVGAGAGGAIGYSLGTLSGALNLNLELSAAEANGDVKVVSSPRVFTSNLQEALIQQDEQIPFDQVTTSGGATTITPVFQSAKLSLRVTPQITADQRIIMELKVNKDTPITNVAGTATAINTKTVETRLLVKNGETVVLGGIYTQTTSDNVSGVPGLMDIPLIGHLFKRKQKTNNRSELLIFITPTVIDTEGESSN